MIVDDVQFVSILEGKRVKLTLKTESYVGVIQRITHKALILSNVVCCSNGGKHPGSTMFCGHDVRKVEFIHEPVADSGGEDHFTVKECQLYRETATWDDDDKEEHIKFVVINEFHEKFGPAVLEIQKQHVIGVGAEGVEAFKQGRMCWLQIATENKVYLFDMLLLGAQAFKNGLSMILEDNRILKVIHDCRAIAGYLISQFGIKLTNIFDTQVADVVCFHSETGGFLPNRVGTLEQVVRLRLKVPSSQLLFLQMKSQLTKEERKVWYKRPCPVPLLKVLALSVVHLRPLRQVLLHTFMSDYMALVDSYLSSSYYEPDELEQINMESVLELPRELRQLKQMHQERKKLAAGHYPVTEQGLLSRFNPQSPSLTSPAAEEQTQTQTQTQEGSFPSAIVESLSSGQVGLHQPERSVTPTPQIQFSSLSRSFRSFRY